VSGCAGDTPSTFKDFHFTARHYGDSRFAARWIEIGRFPTL